MREPDARTESTRVELAPEDLLPVTALFVVVALVAGQVASLEAAWARIAVRVAGSWVAASGLLMLGWALRGVFR